MIIEKTNKLKLTLPRVTADMPLEPKVKFPLPAKSGFCINIIGPAGSGKTSTMVSLVKSRDGYFRRFHHVITVIPSSSLNSLRANPFRDLPDDQKYEELSLENLQNIIETIEESREEDELTLLILDDISAQLQDMDILKSLMRLFLNRRHLYLSIISISHSLTGKGALPYTVRKNCSHIVLFKPSCGLEVLNTEFLHLPKVRFKELIDYVFDKSHNHLMIELNTGQMYKNFNTLILSQ